jgi:hypothetical protein
MGIEMRAVKLAREKWMEGCEQEKNNKGWMAGCCLLSCSHPFLGGILGFTKL